MTRQEESILKATERRVVVHVITVCEECEERVYRDMKLSMM